MRKLLIALALFLAGAATVLLVEKIFYRQPQPNIIEKIIDRSLDKYSIENLSKKNFDPVNINIEKVLEENKDFTSNLISFEVDGKKVTGQLNIPKKEGAYPIIVMARGFVDKEIYETGIGTRRAAASFAGNGFITISPDFLGYGGSDGESTNVFEARFQTYTTYLTLIKSIKGPSFAKATEGKWDGKNIFLWGHSNGGQIVLTALEVTGEAYPTVLWAPVSKPFPYSVLYYTDELSDYGKYLRRELAKFEEIYDVNLYSIHNYYDRIKAPIELHQGTADTAVPFIWSDALEKTLTELKIDIKYFKYPGADHNLNPSWNSVVLRNIEFYRKHSL